MPWRGRRSREVFLFLRKKESAWRIQRFSMIFPLLSPERTSSCLKSPMNRTEGESEPCNGMGTNNGRQGGSLGPVLCLPNTGRIRNAASGEARRKKHGEAPHSFIKPLIADRCATWPTLRPSHQEGSHEALNSNHLRGSKCISLFI